VPEKAREFGIFQFEVLGLVYEIYTKPGLHSERPFDAAQDWLLDPGQAATYQLRMPVRLLRQIISMLLVAAYLSATIFATAPAAYAAPSGMSGGMMQDSTNDQMPMPCKGMKTGCVTELGCVFMVSLPTPDLTVTATIDWSPVTYTVSSEFLDGRSTKPALGPPRSFT
jgi:hypothetical protein